ncbi:MAG: hypothetical protein LBS06_03080 [Treponema sp.]|jgi:hypothetical protein|nr:hypothetical protein [Treponema sp.]
MSKFPPGVLLLSGFFSLILSCGTRGGEGEGKAEPEVPARATAPLAVLRAGENPLWFELAEEGPRLINSPGEAALVPFVPWPLARHVRGILSGAFGETPGAEALVMAVNREGFLRFTPRDAGGDIALYRAADVPRWGPYTLAALFPFEGRAAALLYRDDFFADSDAPLPVPRAFVMDGDSPEPRPLELPALGDFSALEGWDLDALRYSPGGDWYYRAVRKAAGPPEIGYYRTGDLGFKGEAVPVSGFQNAALPEPLSAAPSPLRAVLEACFAPGGGSAAVVFSGRSGPRSFAGSGGAAAAGAGEIAGFYREPAAGRPGAALAVLPGGRGFYAALPAAGAGEPGLGAVSFFLPPLPERYAYTGAALLGDTLFAVWEEQEGHSIGAAGFMVIRFAGGPGSN